MYILVSVCQRHFFRLVLTVGWMMDVCFCFRSVRMQSRIWKRACLCTTQKTTLAWRMPGISSKLRYAYTLNLWSVASEHYVSKQGFVILMSFLSSWQKKEKKNTTKLGLDISAPKSKKCFCAFEFQKTNHKPLAACDNCSWYFCSKWLLETSWSEKLLGKKKGIMEDCNQAFCRFASAE